MLFRSDTLPCDLVLGLAKTRLAKSWDGHTLPTNAKYSNSEDYTYPLAIRAIKLARRHSIPGVLRRAFYEILSI